MEGNKPSIMKAILFATLCLLVFLVSQFLAIFLLTVIMGILVNIPIIGTLLNFLDTLRGESLSMMITVASVFIAYLLTSFLQNKMIKELTTRRLSRRILGIMIAIIHVLSLIVNIVSSGNIFANIVTIIASLVFIFAAVEE